MYDKASRAMFGLLSKSRRLNLPIDIQLQLFDVLVAPILMYGSEIWSYEDCELLEKLHLRYCKYILHLNNSTYKNMVYGELGRYPLSLKIKVRSVVFWRNLLKEDQPKLSTVMYKLMYQLDAVGVYSSPWLTNIRNILNEAGLSYMWQSQICTDSIQNLKYQLKTRLQDQFLQTWSSEISNSSKCINYRMFKHELKLEEYLLKLSTPLCRSLSKFRCRNHRLPIEIGAHFNVARNLRVCTRCMSNDIGDEYHYLFKCASLDSERKKLLPKYCLRHPSSLKFHSIMDTSNTDCLTKLAKFVKLILSV